MSYQLVEQLHKKAVPVGRLCRVLGVSRSGYYGCRQRAKLAPKACLVSTQLKAEFAASGKVYGSRRLSAVLCAQGLRTGRHRVRRLMREHGLRALWRRKFVHTTDSGHALPVSANVLARRFNPSGPNQAWVSDITYIRTRSGWLYLAVVLDLYARKVVGWAMAPTMHAELVCAALQLAIAQRQPTPGLIVHSDRGSQYASALHQALLARHSLVGKHEPQGQLLGQRSDGALLPEPQDAAGLAARLRQPRRCHDRHRRLHRWLLQQRAAALQTGQLATQCLRAAIGNQTTYRCV